MFLQKDYVGFYTMSKISSIDSLAFTSRLSLTTSFQNIEKKICFSKRKNRHGREDFTRKLNVRVFYLMH
jgi:hypothetical protein